MATSMTGLLSCSIALPGGFRAEDMLAFHRRDPQQVAERVTAASLCKGLLWQGMPACLTLAFQAGQAQAQLRIDGLASSACPARFEAMVRHMLGVTQAVEAFEQRHRDHPLLGPLIARQPGLRVPVAATVFEALTWAVTGQQISVAVALSLRRKLIIAADVRHSDGLLCYPDPGRLAGLSVEVLRQAGFSASKASTLLTLAGLVAEERLPLEAWRQTLPVELIREELLRVRGIGPWTVDYSLLRGFGWLDGSLHGDAAVRRALQRLLGTPDAISEQQAKTWLAEFSPWRALVAAHLWADASSTAY
ncbi:MAG: AlkA N-terminal domain-containing protein [Pseudomonas sp.]|uniref:DNA-3-methyladenine glycosylase family protein n=1 Tax=Pseudomonas sp. TaxID=306 RepID=UPI00339B2AA5